NRETPDRYAFTLVSFDELREVVGPRLIKFGLQLAAAKHVVVVFHERRRAPRACEDVEPTASRRERLFDKRNAKLFVMIDAERLQLLIAFLHVRVAAAREVTTVNVGPGERIGDAG